MTQQVDMPRDLGALVVPRVGSLVDTGDVFAPFRLVDAAGLSVAAVGAFLLELQGSGRSVATQRSYGMDLLRWFRFLWAVGVPWNLATRVEARDFMAWFQAARKPRRISAAAGSVAGQRVLERAYAPATLAHAESVLRSFYAYHVECGTGPIVNPFPVVRGGRSGAHRNPMDPFDAGRVGRYRPRVPRRVARQIPDDVFDRLFTKLSSHRDRALVAFWVSTGARASELLGATFSGVDPGGQLITVVRKGSRALQQLPASPDAFVWLRLYQEQFGGLISGRGDDPLWWTLRRPMRPLAYHAARAMFVRVNAALGANWTLHDLRHTAAYRLARDPLMPITDVQWVLGHAHLSTTQRYVTPTAVDVIETVLAHHRREGRPSAASGAAGHSGYRAASLAVLFGGEPS